MFNFERAKTSMNLISPLVDSGKVIAMPLGSMWGDAINCMPSPQYEHFEGESAELLLKMCVNMMSYDEGSEEEKGRAEAFDRISDVLSKSLLQSINVFSNEVQKASLELTERFEEYVENPIDVPEINRYQISVEDIPHVVSVNPGIIESDSYLDKKSKDLYSLKPMDIPQGVIYNGFIEYVDDMGQRSLIKEIGGTNYKRLCGIAFNRTKYVGAIADEIASMNNVEALRVSLALRITCEWLINNIPEKYTGMDLSDYNETLTIMRNNFGTMAAQAYRMLNSYEETDTVILHTTKDTVSVFGPTYKKWINGAGSPDAMLGRLISNNKAIVGSRLTDNVVMFTAKWKSFVEQSMATHGIKAASNNKKFMKRSFMQMFEADRYPSEVAYYESNDDSVVEELVDTWLEDNTGLLVDPASVAVEMIARCRFYYVNAWKFVQHMEAVSRHAPDLPNSRVAFLAAKELLAEHIASVIVVEKG